MAQPSAQPRTRTGISESRTFQRDHGVFSCAESDIRRNNSVRDTGERSRSGECRAGSDYKPARGGRDISRGRSGSGSGTGSGSCSGSGEHGDAERRDEQGHRLSAPLRVVRADSTGGTKRTVYEVSRGVEVTLNESLVEAAAERDMVADDPARQKVAAPQGAAAGVDARQRENAVISGRISGAVATPPSVAGSSLNSISWTERGRKYVLTGPLTTKDLEILKTRLYADETLGSKRDLPRRVKNSLDLARASRM